ncbi:pre-mRNA-processing-splicing factor, partial [Striga asiatica]
FSSPSSSLNFLNLPWISPSNLTNFHNRLFVSTLPSLLIDHSSANGDRNDGDVTTLKQLAASVCRNFSFHGHLRRSIIFRVHGQGVLGQAFVVSLHQCRKIDWVSRGFLAQTMFLRGGGIAVGKELVREIDYTIVPSIVVDEAAVGRAEVEAAAADARGTSWFCHQMSSFFLL